MIGYRAGRAMRPLFRTLLIAGVALPLVACDTDELLEVEEPTFATPPSLRTEAGIPTLFAGAIGDFQIAYSGASLNDSYMAVTAMLSDELRSADTFTSRNANDRRDAFIPVQGNAESDRAYNLLQYARRSTGEIADVIAEIMPAANADARYPRLRALQGFAIVALGEAFCGAVPLSSSVNGVIADLGTPMSTSELMTTAATRFQDALDAAALGATAAHTSALNLARVGMGRALLNNGQYAQAAAAVAGVPTSFIYYVDHSDNSTRQYNQIFALQDNRRYTMTHDTVNDREGINGLPFVSSRDPRTPWYLHTQLGFDQATLAVRTGRYTSYSADVVLADGIEARLIEAEAALNGAGGDWLAILNDLRADVSALMTARYGTQTLTCGGVACNALAPLADPGTPDARVDLLFQERAFWLYATGHRLGDLRRLIRQYGRGAESVFPTGDWHKGGTYGTDVNFPIPFNETQNPNYSESMCNTKQA